ncbi:MAG: flavocytochrome c [Christensenellales bacterium]|jgi:urocanate reductase
MRKRLLSLVLVIAMMLSLPAFAALTPGTYEGEAKGMFDGLKVAVTLDEKGITKVEVLSYNETAPGFPALEKIPQAIVEAQSLKVDAIAGATRSSEGVIAAVTDALTKAGIDLSPFQKELEKKETAPEYLPVMGSFEVPATWDETYDIIVVGGGYAGLAAAYAASTNGANTILVEKLSRTGGNSSINGGQYSAYTSKIAADLQAKYNLVPDTAECHIEDTMKGGDQMSNRDLVENMVYASPFYLDLLLDNGLEVRDTLARPGGMTGYRMYVTKNQVGSDITEVQLKMLQNKTDAVIALEHKMVEIYRTRDEANRVVGIRVSTPEGDKTLKAEKGVILCTGGFGANIPMRETQVPYLDSEIPTTNNPAVSTGEGIYLAQAIGANTTQMSNIQRYPWADPTNGILDRFAVWPFTGPSYGVFYVDYLGNRYVNEGDRRDVCANAAVATGFPSTYSLFTMEVVAGYARQDEVEEGVELGRILKGDTLEELAKKINAYTVKGKNPQVTAENLKNSIERHNKFIDTQVDEDFGKNMAATMIKIGEGPFYALPQFPSVHHTMGGLVVTKQLEVKDIYGNIIPGLYAAGEVTGGVHGTNRLGSNADADAVGNGYVSGYFVATGKMPDFIPTH